MAVSFDTHKFIRRLKEAGVVETQAEAMADAFKEAQGEAQWVTKQDLQIELAPIKADLLLLKWMLGVLLAGVLALILRTFF